MRRGDRDTVNARAEAVSGAHEVADDMDMVRMAHGIVPIGRCRRGMVIAIILRSFDVDRVGMMLVAWMRRGFAHTAVRQHEDASQQHDDHTAHERRLTAEFESGNVPHSLAANSRSNRRLAASQFTTRMNAST